MPIYYDIKTDGLYLLGIEVGIKKGIDLVSENSFEVGVEFGIKKQMRFVIIRMLQAKKYSLYEIAHISGATRAFILTVANELDITF